MEKQEKRNFNGKKYRGKQTDSNKGKKSGEMKKPVQKQKSVCPVFEKCGGCQLLDVPYEKQVKKKEKQLQEQLRSFGRLEPFIAMENPLHYRHKVKATFGRDQKGNIISGNYREGTHYLVPVDNCLLDN